MTDVRFAGDIGALQGIALALLVASAAWFLYHRQIQHRGGLTALALPSLRALATFLLVLMLTQPVLHHRRVVGELGRVFVVIDSSRSLNIKDPDTTPARKILNARTRGRLGSGFADADQVEAISKLEHSHRKLAFLVNRSTSLPVLIEAGEEYTDILKNALSEVKSLGDVQASTAPGSITREVWTGVQGYQIAPVANSETLKKAPNKREKLTTFEGPVDEAENYISRVRGYIHPPKDGAYTFWIASDDQAQLYLSTDGDEKNKQLIAWVKEWTAPRNWHAFPEQKSKTITLKAGQRYYIEALHKESLGGDNLSVGWQLPDGKKELPIEGRHLSPLSGVAGVSAADYALGVRKHLGDFEKAQKERNRANVVPVLRELLADGAATLELLQNRLHAELARLAAAGQPDVDKAVREYDQLTRWQRLQGMLFDGKEPLVETLAEQHEVELHSLKGKRLETLWRSKAGRLDESTEVPAFLSSTPVMEITDLSPAMQLESSKQKVAIVLLSDGQHNHGNSPLKQAQVLGQKGIPVYTVGFGARRAPQDLAIRSITGPESIYVKDLATGTITFNDNMDVGKPFHVRVMFKGNLLWEKALQTDGSGLRRVPFSFAVEEQVERLLARADSALKYQSIPMRLNVEIAEIEGDRQRKNNVDTFDLLVATRRRSILLIDQRPRWEWRYLKSMFRRDDKWDVNCVLPKQVGEKMVFYRGKQDGMLPDDREEFFKHDLIIMGDVTKEIFNAKELGWLQEFVTVRAGGLILIDGRRQHLRGYSGTVFDSLLPVTWETGPALRKLAGIELTAAGRNQAALDLSDKKRPNDEVWAGLPPFHWVPRVKAVPGTEVMAEVKHEDKKSPLFVYRRAGGGKVLYCATGDLWRWRYRRADKYHQRFWNQVVDWIMERPFAVQDSHVSIDAGPAAYQAGQSAEFRVRLRDVNGRPMGKAKAEVLLHRKGRLQAILPLSEDDESGIYRARSAKLIPGDYKVRVRVADIDDDRIKAQATFRVREPVSRELSELACNSKLLQEIAMRSNGAFFREEQIHELLDVLKPLSSGRVEETDTAIWQSYWYFGLVVLLLTTEWLWRKKRGLL